MPTIDARARRLVADVGGTNSRLALFDPVADELRAVHTYINRDYQRFEDVVATWIGSLCEPAPTTCCIAVAAPPADDLISMANMDWAFSCRELAARFGFTQLKPINDFQGNAYALAHLGKDDLVVLHAGRTPKNGKRATVGPGTGLGGSTLEIVAGRAMACACEPGHMGLAPATAIELELFRVLLPHHGEIHAELLVSGPGLLRLYQGLAAVHGTAPEQLTPEEISRRALQGQDELCTQSLTIFCALLGSVCGDFVLANGAYSGLYLAGGIVPQMIPFLHASNFAQRFRDKGAMTSHLNAVPLYAITAAYPALIGAAHAPL
ncbi:MAG: glucokinase [Halioglobus sp.]